MNTTQKTKDARSPNNVFPSARWWNTFTCLTCLLVWGISCPLRAALVNVTYGTVWDVPITASSYTATGNTIQFTLDCIPPTGTNLTVIRNTGLRFIQGTFSNLSQGQMVV